MPASHTSRDFEQSSGSSGPTLSPWAPAASESLRLALDAFWNNSAEQAAEVKDSTG